MTEYVVKRGDSLWKIAKTYPSYIAGNTTNAKIDTLVAINGIKNRNLIYVGQVIKFSATTSSQASSSPTSSGSTTNKAVINGFGLQANSETGRDMYAYWSWGKRWDHFKHYKVRWEWYVNGHTECEESEITQDYSNKDNIPKDSPWVQVFILPVAENKLDSEGKDTGVPYWTADGETGQKYDFSNNPPLKLTSAPKVDDINKETLTLTAKYENIVASDLDAIGVAFNVVQDNSVSLGISNPVTIDTTANYVAFQYPVTTGHTYTVRARTVAANGLVSGWSDFSESKGTQPPAPAEITTYTSYKRTDGVYAAFLEWTAVTTATKYTIEYVNVETDFETTPSNIKPVPVDTARTSIEITLDDIGIDYFFRVKAVNDDGESDPSPVVKLIVGDTPNAPATTWSTFDSVFVGDDAMELHWVHNPKDNSKQTYAQLSLNINDGGWDELELMENSTKYDDNDEVTKEYTYGTAVSYKGDLYFKIDTNHPDLKNAKIQWMVRTAGITQKVSDTAWSTPRTIYIYEKPDLAVSMTSDMAGTGALITTLTSFPFYVRAKDTLSDHKIQRPVGYHLQIISNDYYVTVDDVGRSKTINPGDNVYSKYFDTSSTLVVEMSANNLDLESGVNYTVLCTEDLSSGLAISNKHDFTVSWVDVEYTINADISVNTEAYTALITPYCREKIPVACGKNMFNVSNHGAALIDNGVYLETKAIHNKVEHIEYIVKPNTEYTLHFESYDSTTPWIGLCIDDWTGNNSGWSRFTKTFTTNSTGKLVLKIGANSSSDIGHKICNVQLEEGSEATEYEEYYETYEDGGLVENITLSVYRREYDGSYKEITTGIPNNNTAVTDPHPALDYARYRFTAKDTKTGALSFWDMAGFPVNGSAVVLQWDEVWSTFDTGNSVDVEGPSWNGSLLRLPYNIKVTDKRNPEVTLVEYAGRKHPVSYYGTQVGETSQWSVEIPKDDKDTIYALRRLSLWAGDVYVREPSGMGYWANVSVSFNQSYNDVKIPVSLDITRVEGGV